MAFYSQWTALTPTPLVSKYVHQMLMLQKVLLINFFTRFQLINRIEGKNEYQKKGTCVIYMYLWQKNACRCMRSFNFVP